MFGSQSPAGSESVVTKRFTEAVPCHSTYGYRAAGLQSHQVAVFAPASICADPPSDCPLTRPFLLLAGATGTFFGTAFFSCLVPRAADTRRPCRLLSLPMFILPAQSAKLYNCAGNSNKVHTVLDT